MPQKPCCKLILLRTAMGIATIPIVLYGNWPELIAKVQATLIHVRTAIQRSQQQLADQLRKRLNKNDLVRNVLGHYFV